ncbi:cupredoxin domain-containing protein [Patescibacteria group bacterium]|nr:cupredoxin domain-containing protein [Patescibacteria group bacterium]
MNKIILIIIILVAIAGGYFLFQSSSQQEEAIETSPQLGVPAPGQELVPEMIVTPDETEEPLPEDEAAVVSLDDQVQPEKVTTLSVKEIKIVSDNLFFTPKVLTLIKDQPVKIIFQNTGTHTFTIKELDVNLRLSESSVTLEFTPSKSGIFEYYCAVPGHRENGMFGSLTVKE